MVSPDQKGGTSRHGMTLTGAGSFVTEIVTGPPSFWNPRLTASHGKPRLELS